MKKLADEKAVLAEEKSVLADDKTKLADEKSKLADEMTVLADEKSRLADEILALPGIDEIHIGLNDLSIGYGQPFLFQPLADGTLDLLCPKFRARDIPFGFGGIARLGGGAVPAEIIIREHCRLGSQRAILSRSFCNTDKTTDLTEIEAIFRTGLTELRQFEAAFDRTPEALAENHAELRRRVADVVRKMEEGQ